MNSRHLREKKCMKSPLLRKCDPSESQKPISVTSDKADYVEPIFAVCWSVHSCQLKQPKLNCSNSCNDKTVASATHVGE